MAGISQARENMSLYILYNVKELFIKNSKTWSSGWLSNACVTFFWIKLSLFWIQVIGNMAPAVVTASPALRAAVIQCVNQPAASQAVQQAAIQVYRLTSVPAEASHFISKFSPIIEIILLFANALILFGHRAERFSGRYFWTVPAPCKSVLLHIWYLWRTLSPRNCPSWLMS